MGEMGEDVGLEECLGVLNEELTGIV